MAGFFVSRHLGVALHTFPFTYREDAMKKVTSLIIVLLSISSICLSQDPNSAAFGIRLGSNFDVTSSIGSNLLTDGTPMYKFKPENSFRSFSRYYVLITPKTKKVYSIWGIGDIDSDAKCKKEQDLVMAILVKKYGEMDDQGLMSSLYDSKTISQGDKSVSTKCSGFSDVTIDIRYYDHELKTLAEKERIELESEKLDSSGL